MISFFNLGSEENWQEYECVTNGSSSQIIGETYETRLDKFPFDNYIIAKKLKVRSHSSTMSMLECRIIYPSFDGIVNLLTPDYVHIPQ